MKRSGQGPKLPSLLRINPTGSSVPMAAIGSCARMPRAIREEIGADAGQGTDEDCLSVRQTAAAQRAAGSFEGIEHGQRVGQEDFTLAGGRAPWRPRSRRRWPTISSSSARVLETAGWVRLDCSAARPR